MLEKDDEVGATNYNKFGKMFDDLANLDAMLT